MAGPIVYVDRSVIRSPDVAGLRAAVRRLVDFVREREPQLLFYGFEVDEAAASMSVVAVHPDSESLELHLSVGGPEFRKVGAFIELRHIDVYGHPTEAVRRLLDEKAAMLGPEADVSVHELHAAFQRLSSGHA